MYKFIQKQNGFTLVEVLVSISLLLVVLAGPLSYLAGSSQNSKIANEQIPATFLTQEGAELVHKVRDDELVEWFRNGFSGTPWSDMKTVLAPCFTTAGCGLEADSSGRVTSADIYSCDSGNECLLYKKQTSGGRIIYTYDDAGSVTATPYTRVIYLEEVSPGREVEVVSRVTWRSGSLIQEQQVEVKTSIFNVYDTN